MYHNVPYFHVLYECACCDDLCAPCGVRGGGEEEP